MTSAQPIDLSDAFAIEGLDTDVIASVSDQIESIICDDENDGTASLLAGPTLALAAAPPPRPARTIETSVAEAHDEAEASIDQSESTGLVQAADANRVSRADLVKILEGFVGLIKSGDEQLATGQANQLSFSPPSTSIATVSAEEKTVEIQELKSLLVEAQSTIITLLTDRVDDRARIAHLETQLSLLPDLQSQADRAMAVAISTDDLRDELHRVKQEINKVRGTMVRNEITTTKRSWFDSVRCWLFRKETGNLR